MQLSDVKLIQALMTAIPESAFQPEEYETTWNVMAFVGEDPLESEDSDQVVDVRDGIDVVIVFNYQGRGTSVPENNGPESDGEDADRAEADTEAQRGLQIVGTFLLQYSIRQHDDRPESIDESVEASSTDVVAFANFNATFNAWPYWREFVQSMAGRMGLSGVVVPVLPVPNLIGRTRAQ